MQDAADLQYVPQLLMTLNGVTLVVHENHCWNLVSWQRGTSDLLTRPTLACLEAAGNALAHLHRRWQPQTEEHMPCPAVARRLRLLAEWEQACFRFAGRPEEVSEVLQSVELVRVHFAHARAELQRHVNLRGRVVGIHGDFWPENLLFTFNHGLTAVLDFGNVGLDHPEVDLGRLFADVPGTDRRMILAAVEAYNAVARFDLSASLVELLAVTGRLGSLANWHLRLNVGSPDSGLLSLALPRIRRLVGLILAQCA
jgi:aminoglycoside phosphotransferase (APT) family kinase protein